MSRPVTTPQLPPSVNWHLWPTCNFACRYCFQPESISPPPLPREDALRVPHLLAEAGVSKLTFVGGEPTLCPHLWDLISEAKNAGLTTMLVTNGSHLTVAEVPQYASTLDHLAVSVDTLDDATARAIGRGNAASARHALAILAAAKAAGMGTKTNVVINALNWREDMTPAFLEAAPDRLKVFRALHVPGVNDSGMQTMGVTDEQWAQARSRYSAIGAVCENNDDMRESYAMLDAEGRFFQNSPTGYVRSRGILDIGVDAAFSQITLDLTKFIGRGGLYVWSR